MNCVLYTRECLIPITVFCWDRRYTCRSLKEGWSIPILVTAHVYWVNSLLMPLITLSKKTGIDGWNCRQFSTAFIWQWFKTATTICGTFGSTLLQLHFRCISIKCLPDDLGDIDHRLHFSTMFDAILWALDKAVSLPANYPKGFGDMFKHWLLKYHPGALLVPVQRTAGSRQDLATEGAGAVYWNRIYYVEFLDECLRLE
jgi:hypothetical protein